MSNDLQLVLNQQLAARMGQTDFSELMQKISTYEVQSANVRVTTDEEYQLATDSLVAVADVAKALENMRKEIVAYPNTFTKTVNDTFRNLKQRCEKSRQRLEYHAKAWKAKKDAEYARQQAEAAQAAMDQAQEGEVVDADAEQVQMPEPPQPPLQSTKATNGKGSVSYRKGRPEIEIINAAKLVRASVDTRNKVPSDVISIDMAAVRKAVEAETMTHKQWEKYGVKVTQKEEMVVRT
jgi:hypothetical protein